MFIKQMNNFTESLSHWKVLAPQTLIFNAFFDYLETKPLTIHCFLVKSPKVTNISMMMTMMTMMTTTTTTMMMMRRSILAYIMMRGVFIDAKYNTFPMFGLDLLLVTMHPFTASIHTSRDELMQ